MRKFMKYIALDIHKDSITVSVACETRKGLEALWKHPGYERSVG